MDERLEISAKSEKEAIKKALDELGLEASQAEVEVETLEKNNKRILGLVGSKEQKYIVKIKNKNIDKKDSADKEEPQDIKQEAEKTLRKTLNLMQVSAEIKSITEKDEAVEIEIEGEDSGILIGRRGQTLDALQYLLNVMVNRGIAEPKRIVLDIEEYRARRMTELQELASRTAERAVQSKSSIALRPMSAYERRIVHMALQGNDEVETVSEGEEPDRRVLIVPKS